MNLDPDTGPFRGWFPMTLQIGTGSQIKSTNLIMVIPTRQFQSCDKEQYVLTTGK